MPLYPIVDEDESKNAGLAMPAIRQMVTAEVADQVASIFEENAENFKFDIQTEIMEILDCELVEWRDGHLMSLDVKDSIERLRDDVQRSFEDLEERVTSQLSASTRLKREGSRFTPPMDESSGSDWTESMGTEPLLSGLASYASDHRKRSTHHLPSAVADPQQPDFCDLQKTKKTMATIKDQVLLEIREACEQGTIDLRNDVESGHSHCSCIDSRVVERLWTVENDIKTISSSEFLRKATFVSLGLPTQTLETENPSTSILSLLL